MNRRSFFKAASGLLLAAAAPLAIDPERRVWALDRTMAGPGLPRTGDFVGLRQDDARLQALITGDTIAEDDIARFLVTSNRATDVLLAPPPSMNVYTASLVPEGHVYSVTAQQLNELSAAGVGLLRVPPGVLGT